MHRIAECAVCLLVAAGPVDAAYKAIDGLVRVDAELVDYSVNSVTEGIQALATTRVTIRPTGAMKDEAYVERAGGFGGKVQRTFSGTICAPGWHSICTLQQD